jgi:hypothetical protein
MDNRELENVLSTQRREIASLRAETFALQAVMTHLAESVVEKPDLRPTLLKAFDDAAAKVAHMSLMREGQASDFLPEALEIIDRFREAFTGAHPEAVRTP